MKKFILIFSMTSLIVNASSPGIKRFSAVPTHSTESDKMSTMQPTPREQAEIADQASGSALNRLSPETFDRIMAKLEQISTSLENGTQRLADKMDRFDEQATEALATIIDDNNTLRTIIGASCAKIIAETDAFAQALRDDR